MDFPTTPILGARVKLSWTPGPREREGVREGEGSGEVCKGGGQEKVWIREGGGEGEI